MLPASFAYSNVASKVDMTTMPTSLLVAFNMTPSIFIKANDQLTVTIP